MHLPLKAWVSLSFDKLKYFEMNYFHILEEHAEEKILWWWSGYIEEYQS